ncbi:hypothetical protein P3L10_005921 [Capsicum annuum]
MQCYVVKFDLNYANQALQSIKFTDQEKILLAKKLDGRFASADLAGSFNNPFFPFPSLSYKALPSLCLKLD